MAVVPRFYNNYIAEGRGFLIFSIVFAICMRVVYIVFSDMQPVDVEGGYLWQFLDVLSKNALISPIGSSIIVGAMALSVAHINTDFALIRRRTLLPPAIIILLFSCSPLFVWISPSYIGVLFMLIIISTLFSSYGNAEKPVPAFKITFILSLGSLFSPVLLFYIPFTWFALVMMRCFNFKSLLTSLFGIFIVYFPVFSFYLFTDNLNEFLSPFMVVGDIQKLALLPCLDFNVTFWIYFVFIILLLIVIVTDNYFNRHKDKIRIRAYLSVLVFFASLSLLLFTFLNIGHVTSLFIFLGILSLLLSHFFSLAETKMTVILFYFYLLLYLSFCVLSIFGIV